MRDTGNFEIIVPDGIRFSLQKRVKSAMKRFLKHFDLSLDTYLNYLPALMGGILVFIITLILANFFSKVISKYSLKRTKDSLIANFIGKIIWAVVFILGTVFTLGILGLGTISNKILAGAGITTFIVGFALKDIGENFLAGLILAFSRPYKVNSLIECVGIKGIVKDMTLRQTTVEAEDGRIILIPNSKMISNPLIKYSNNRNTDLRQEFFIHVEQEKAREASDLITETIASYDHILKIPEKPIRVTVDSLYENKVKLLAVFWFDTQKLEEPEAKTKSEIIYSVMETLEKNAIKFSG
jgi:small conductance mechanosensitive channel